jgi:hypothetical protein
MSKPTWTRNITAKSYTYTTRSGTITIEIDLDRLFQELGRRALFSKGKRSGLMAGVIKATAHSIEEVLPK